ncbi:MAG: hypothetical protein PHR35_07535 [Kiritimatiellae bacterium]|nr:hypothetical protein [Kiritimatiellia bacterium]
MSRLEKHAWFNIGVFAVACALFALARPYVGVLPATGCFGLCGLWGFGPHVFYRKGKMGPSLDERESAIMRRAWQAGHGVFWLLFVSSFMLAWSFHRNGNVTVPAEYLPLMVFAAMILVVLVQSLAMLILCKTGLKNAE